MNEEMKRDVVISSRIRFARNIADYPFAGKCDPTSASEIIEKVRNAVGSGFIELDSDKADDVEIGSLVENHSISREFAESKLPHALFTSNDGVLKIMVCEEDHIRLQAITEGLSLKEAYNAACAEDEKLCCRLNIAFNDRLGFLTHCPTNLGTGMRASVMMFLPALSESGNIQSLSAQLSKLGLTIRGLYGEGSDGLGCIYQISNTETLGVTEHNVISKLEDVINKVIGIERDMRKRIYESDPDKMTDRSMRALGILKYSKILDSSEFMRCYSDLRLGISLGVVEDVDVLKLDKAFTEVMPYNLMKRFGKKMNASERDIMRAKYIKELI